LDIHLYYNKDNYNNKYFLLYKLKSVPFFSEKGVIAIKHRNIQFFDMLLNYGADPNSADNNGTTALMISCCNEYEDFVEKLLNKGADPYYETNLKMTALLCSCSSGNVNIVKKLLDNGVDPNTKNIDSITPLMVASNKNYTEIIKILLDYGADYSIKNIRGSTALIHAMNKNNTESINILVKHIRYKNKIQLAWLSKISNDDNIPGANKRNIVYKMSLDVVNVVSNFF
jgi:ankyrin repeat protein